MWLPDFHSIVDAYPKASNSKDTLKGDELQLADNKLSYVLNKELTIHYYEKDGHLTALCLQRPDDYGLLAYLFAKVEGGEVLNEHKSCKLPKDLQFMKIEEEKF